MKIIILIILIVIQYVIAQNDSTAGISETAAELYQKCASLSKSENIILSPFSISNAMALLSLGSKGKTHQEIVHGMKLASEPTKIGSQFQSYFATLNKSQGENSMTIINQIYAQNGHAINIAFQTVAVNYFKSGIETVDFDNPESVAHVINSFVSNNTNHKIENIINANAINANTGLILINALHFKGNWEHEFNVLNTFEDNFHSARAKQRSISYMKDEHNYRYVELNDINAKAIELRFIDSDMAFVIVLPNNPNGISTLEAQLRYGNFSKIMESMRYECVQITMPKFEIEYEVDMEAVLRQLGMNDMFEDSADFSGIFKSNKPLKVTTISHKAFINVNEYGCEAAASTLSGFEFNSLKNCPPVTKNFTADRPFLFHIIDLEKHIILFSGRYI